MGRELDEFLEHGVSFLFFLKGGRVFFFFFLVLERKLGLSRMMMMMMMACDGLTFVIGFSRW